ncbi:MAG: hypothetical protein M0C28_15675 [Candidatus Moduliflexus flocculans]|nr:hypothetical protein [Candidatus Moduliflexus flocculans]
MISASSDGLGSCPLLDRDHLKAELIREVPPCRVKHQEPGSYPSAREECGSLRSAGPALARNASRLSA